MGAEQAAKVAKWSNDWLSILGVSKGLTGLAKEFVLGYLGRSSYHDSNGQLIQEIKSVSGAFGYIELDGVHMKKIRSAVVRVCQAGKRLFAKDGSLHLMLTELDSIVQHESNMPHFQSALKTNEQVKELFVYLAGPAPESSDEL